jgi:hypothetical protein
MIDAFSDPKLDKSFFLRGLESRMAEAPKEVKKKKKVESKEPFYCLGFFFFFCLFVFFFFFFFVFLFSLTVVLSRVRHRPYASGGRAAPTEKADPSGKTEGARGSKKVRKFCFFFFPFFFVSFFSLARRREGAGGGSGGDDPKVPTKSPRASAAKSPRTSVKAVVTEVSKEELVPKKGSAAWEWAQKQKEEEEKKGREAAREAELSGLKEARGDEAASAREVAKEKERAALEDQKREEDLKKRQGELDEEEQKEKRRQERLRREQKAKDEEQRIKEEEAKGELYFFKLFCGLNVN